VALDLLPLGSLESGNEALALGVMSAEMPQTAYGTPSPSRRGALTEMNV
jgi:hypothetical protein